MTNQEKIDILNQMYNLINQNVCIGFCKAYSLAMKDVSFYFLNDLSKEAALNSLGLFKPKNWDLRLDDWWYDRIDKQSRLDAITEAINKLKE